MYVPKIDPKWRTDTVLALCRTIRETEDYNACPILADALQDAGCDDEQLLDALRGPPAFPYSPVLVAVVNEPVGAARAVKAIEDLAARLGPHQTEDYDYVTGASTPGRVQEMNFEVLMTAGRGADGLIQYGSDSWRDEMTNEAYDLFWKSYAVLTGEAPPADTYYPDKLVRFIGCSC